MILLFLFGKRAGAAVTNGMLLPSGTTTRPPEQGVALGTTGTRLCCGTAAPLVVPAGSAAASSPSQSAVAVATPLFGTNAVLPSPARQAAPVSQMTRPVVVQPAAPSTPVAPKLSAWQTFVSWNTPQTRPQAVRVL